MKAGGYICVARAAFEHPMFADEPYTRMQAWLWLISAAAFRQHKIKGGIALERGEFSFSVRFLAERWQWSKTRVARVLQGLKYRDMIRDTSRDNTTVYLISNYNEYQHADEDERDSDRDTSRDLIGTPTGQPRDKEEERRTTDKKTDKKTLSKKRHSKNDLNGHAENFEQFYAVYPKREAKRAAAFAYTKALTRAGPGVILDGAKRYAAARKGEDPTYTRLPATWLNADGWLDETPLLKGIVPAPGLELAMEAEREHRRKHGEIT